MIIRIEVHDAQSQDTCDHDAVAAGDEHLSQLVAQQSLHLGHDIGFDFLRYRGDLFSRVKDIFC